jgi:hypothetical protein
VCDFLKFQIKGHKYFEDVLQPPTAAGTDNASILARGSLCVSRRLLFLEFGTCAAGSCNKNWTITRQQNLSQAQLVQSVPYFLSIALVVLVVAFGVVNNQSVLFLYGCQTWQPAVSKDFTLLVQHINLKQITRRIKTYQCKARREHYARDHVAANSTKRQLATAFMQEQTRRTKMNG